MENTSKLDPMKTRDRAYYRQRQKNRVFTELVRFFADEAERRQITKKDLAEALAKDPAQITRWLSAPSNFELDTLSDILLALGAEMDHRIVRFSDRANANYAHPLVVAQPKMTVEISRPKPSADSSALKPTGALKVTTQGSADLHIVPALAVAEP
jgi:hypothetical protein